MRNFGIYAVSLFNKRDGQGVRVRLAPARLDRWPLCCDAYPVAPGKLCRPCRGEPPYAEPDESPATAAASLSRPPVSLFSRSRREGFAASRAGRLRLHVSQKPGENLQEQNKRGQLPVLRTVLCQNMHK